MSPQLEIQLIAVIVAVACALPGVFLVLRKMSMMSDSITHTILLGIVLVERPRNPFPHGKGKSGTNPALHLGKQPA